MAQKTCKVGDISTGNGRFTIIYHTDDQYNPYWVYRHYWTFRAERGPAKHSNLMVKYADIKSCLWYIAQQF